MTETIAIITLVASIAMPIATVLVGAVAYAIRKVKKSSCLYCWNFESADKSPQLDKIEK